MAMADGSGGLKGMAVARGFFVQIGTRQHITIADDTLLCRCGRRAARGKHVVGGRTTLATVCRRCRRSYELYERCMIQIGEQM